MSLQFILGASGSGKSTWMNQWAVEEAASHPQKKYIVIVPEQFTLQTQKDLVKAHPCGGILNIDVLSFKRLALRVFEETGTNPGEVLTEIGKTLILRQAAGSVRASLKVMGSRIDQPGYIAQIKSALSEFALYGIHDEEMADMLRDAPGGSLLRAKLEDLRLLGQAARACCAGRYIMGEELLEILARCAPESSLIKDSTFLFDGFTGFTPVQRTALRAILSLSPAVKIALTIDEREKLYGSIKEHELFALSKKTMEGIVRDCRDLHVETLEPVILSARGKRFRPGSQLDRLEQNLFRPGRHASAHKDAGQSEDVRLFYCANPRQEALRTAVAIRKLVDEEGFAYGQIGVIAGSLPDYAPYVRRMFALYHIPVFIDQTVPVTGNPCMAFIRGVLSLIEERFSYESVFRFLKTGGSGLSFDQIDRMENYVLALGIRGYRRFAQPWTALPSYAGEEEVQFCENARKCLMDILDDFLCVFRGEKKNVRSYVEAVYRLLVRVKMQQRLEENAERLRSEGKVAEARENEQIFDVVLRLFDEMVNLLGDQVMSVSEFSDILEAGFADARIGIAPPSAQEVHVGDLQRTRLGRIRVLFFLGLNDGWVPGAIRQDGIITPMDRELLENAGYVLAPGNRENTYIQRFYLYLGLTRASERLYLSYSLTDSEQKALRPSYLVRMLGSMLDLEAQNGDLEEKLSSIRNYPSALRYLALRLGVGGRETRGDTLLKNRLLETDACARQTRAILKAAQQDAMQPEALSASSARLLYGQDMTGSVTRLERYAVCPFWQYVLYGLKLREREIYRVREADMGSLLHRALQEYALMLRREDMAWTDLSPAEQEDLARKALDHCTRRYRSGLFADTARNAFYQEKLLRILIRTVHTLTMQLGRGRFAMSEVELPFTQTGEILLQGRIDRIDTCMDEGRVLIKVIDYKSGMGTTFDLNAMYDGLQLQLPLYLYEANAIAAEKYPGREIVPAGLLYYYLKDPIVQASPAADDAGVEQLLYKELRPKGRVNADPRVIDLMDTAFTGSSLAIPVEKRTDGSVSARSSVMTGKQFSLLMNHAWSRANTFSADILAGKMKPYPYTDGKKKGCDYCPYHTVCLFDERMPDASCRKIPAMSEPQIWEQISQNNKERENGSELD